MKESDFWRYIRGGMSRYWHATRIENSTQAGVPDVTYGVDGQQGWIELKVLPSFPKRDTTPIRIDHWTPEQKLWMRERGRISGNVWLFIEVQREFFLFWWDRALQCEEWTTSQWRERANGYWKGEIDWQDLYDTLM